MFNQGQLSIYTEILAAVLEIRPLCAFIDGKTGRGKTRLLAIDWAQHRLHEYGAVRALA
ncbi:hypothetical protein B0H13DRAFT_1601354 [Mycena leptocephala]|nr:hypothetical protein B0H13DRAFT_1601354 [Mycena leptocephala]